MNRRTMMAGALSTVLATAAGTEAMARGRRLFFERIGKPIGLQIYTLGPEAGKDVDATFAEVARIGYREIELPSLLGRTPADIAAAARRAGLAIGSIHLPLMGLGGPAGALSLLSEPARIADDLGTLGARWAVAPLAMFPADFRPRAGEDMAAAIARSFAAAGADPWKRTAETLNSKASALRPLGIGVGYHNHNLEFAPIGKTTGWDVLVSETDPALVKFEVDLGWVATAGRDPVRFLRRHRGRVRLLHVKDVARDNGSGFTLSMKPAEVGSGALDWSRILPAAQAAGVEHYFVEQEPPFTIPRIEAARRSYDYLSALRA